MRGRAVRFGFMLPTQRLLDPIWYGEGSVLTGETFFVAPFPPNAYELLAVG